jgi:hypothetical protein
VRLGPPAQLVEPFVDKDRLAMDCVLKSFDRGLQTLHARLKDVHRRSEPTSGCARTDFVLGVLRPLRWVVTAHDPPRSPLGSREWKRERPNERQIDAILDAELQRALIDLDPLRRLAQLTARFWAAFVLDPQAMTRTKALGSERMARKLRDALPGGESPLRAAVWDFLRPMLSPTLVALNRDAFVLDGEHETTVDLQAHRSPSNRTDLDLGDDLDTAA